MPNNPVLLTEFRESMKDSHLTEKLAKGKRILANFSFSLSTLIKWAGRDKPDLTEAEKLEIFRDYMKREVIPTLEEKFDIKIKFFLRGSAKRGWSGRLRNVNDGSAFWVYVAKKNRSNKTYALSKAVEVTLEEIAHIFQDIHFLEYFSDKPKIRKKITEVEKKHFFDRADNPIEQPFCRDIAKDIEDQARKTSQEIILCDKHLENALQEKNLDLLGLLNKHGAHPWLAAGRLVDYIGQEHNIGAVVCKISYNGDDFSQSPDLKENGYCGWFAGRRIVRNLHGELESIFPFEVKRRLVFNKEEVVLKLRWVISNTPYLVYACPWRVMGKLKDIVVLLVEENRKKCCLPFMSRGDNQ